VVSEALDGRASAEGNCGDPECDSDGVAGGKPADWAGFGNSDSGI